MDEALELVETFENILAQTKGEWKDWRGKGDGYQGNRFRSGGYGSGSGAGDSSGHAPMELGAMDKSPPRKGRKKRSPEEEKEWRRRMLEGLCFECGKKGHLIGDCPNRTESGNDQRPAHRGR